MTTKTSLSAAFALSLALTLGGCATEEELDDPIAPTAQETDDDALVGDDEETGDGTAAAVPPPGDDDTTDGATGDEATGDDDVTARALQAIATAEEHAGGTAYEIDDQDDDGSWEVDVAVGDRSVEVTVGADGTTVVETDDDDLDDDDRAGLEAATITLVEAIELAVAEVGGVLDEAELNEDDGSYYWEVELDGTDRGDDIEVKVSVTGEILEVD